MKVERLAESHGIRTFAVVLDPGEEAFSCLTRFAGENDITGASITAIGAFETATLAWFDVATKEYRDIPVAAQSEVLSVIGDIGRDEEGKPSLHAHAVLGFEDGSTKGGHLVKGIVRPTLEVVVMETPKHLHRRKRPELGVALIDLDSYR